MNFFELLIDQYIALNFYFYYIKFIYTSKIEPLFNLSMISSFIQYIHFIGINLLSPSKGKSSKSLFQGLLTHIKLSNNSFIKLTFNLSTILLSKQYIGCFVNNLFHTQKVSNRKSDFKDNFRTFISQIIFRSD